MEAAGPCGLCQRERAPYTCPRCNVRFCSVPCYRGHGACAEAFYRRQLLLRFQGQRRDPASRACLKEALIRLRELRESGDAELQLGRGPEDQEDGLWELLSPAQKVAFQRLLSSGEIGAILPQWRPWWQRASRGLVQELGGAESAQEAGDTQPLAGTQKSEEKTQGTAPIYQPPVSRGACPPMGTQQPGECQGIAPTQQPEEVPSPVPAVLASIPLLSSLTRSPASPLVCFQLPNALYAYVFALTLYNGDLSEDELLPEFSDMVMDVSGALGSRQVFHSTAEALQAALQAVTASQYSECPLGNAGAMMAVAQILMGESQAKQKGYSLSALSHLARLLGKAKNLVPTEERSRVYGAKKKCEFLLSWVNENQESLTVLALEVQREYKTHLEAVKEVDAVTRELEKMWGGKLPPAKKPLIKELD
ncbi:zinc finger HIT domain-containing protein 2 [Emydura macquarii macquarii]|uniref:zinc finger HIT domain-containing protein 2 n=1 Tax=Emydura macquarii macquarii TaxID=1129001 RepID=UPI00352B9EB6